MIRPIVFSHEQIKLFPRQRRAYTLLEVLIVIAIMGALLGLLVVCVQRVRESSSQVKCQANLKNLTLAVQLHHNDKRAMPPYSSGKGHEMYGGWLIHLLPYIGHAEIYERLKAAQHIGSADFQLVTGGRTTLTGISFAELTCDTDPTRGRAGPPRTNYVANWYALSDGKKGAFRPARSFHHLTDGLSHVVLYAEAYRDCQRLPRLALYSFPYHNFGITQDGLPSDDRSYAPNDYTMFQIKPKDCAKWRTQTAHAAMPVAMADGTCRFVGGSISARAWTQLLKPGDGNPSADW